MDAPSFQPKSVGAQWVQIWRDSAQLFQCSEDVGMVGDGARIHGSSQHQMDAASQFLLCALKNEGIADQQNFRRRILIDLRGLRVQGSIT